MTASNSTLEANGKATRVPKRLYTVAPGAPFLDTVARAVLSGDLPSKAGSAPDMLDLPNYVLMLPTPRAARAMPDAFLRASPKHNALILPRIQAITESDDDLTLLSSLAGAPLIGHDANLDLPPAISDIERHITLTKLVLHWSRTKAKRADADRAGYLSDDATAMGRETPAQAAGLAGELAQLMDSVEREGVSLDALSALVPDTFSAHWQDTLDFLKIITEMWPRHLDDRGLSAKVERRNTAILSEAKRLSETRPTHPVIIAGVTGSIPATAELMRVVASLDNGAIILPGLDKTLDEESWEAITAAEVAPGAAGRGHPEHPQYGLKRLLDTLGVNRSDVDVIGEPPRGDQDQTRRTFFSEALRPASTTATWQNLPERKDLSPENIRDALEPVHLIDTANAQDEAEAIALIMREVAESEGRTAALVSPDRILARRVGVRLESWGIRVDDSAGRPFIKTTPGTFLDLIANAIATKFAPAEIVSLLKHPLTRLGFDPFTIRKSTRALEIAAFRTDYLGSGLSGIDEALHRARLETETGERRHRAVRRIHDEDWNAAHDIVARLADAFSPLTPHFETDHTAPFQSLVKAHLATAEAIARLPLTEPNETDPAKSVETETDDTPEYPLWLGAAGEQASTYFADLLSAELPDFSIAAHDYPDFSRGLLNSFDIRERLPVHPRLSIWGLFESRLQQPDVVILGGLNEGTWPSTTDPGPWLNRSMRREIGLPSPEEEIGRQAHDFATLLQAETVYLSRAEKSGGTPTVPSRWLMRIEALCAGLDCKDALRAKAPWAGWARARDAVPRVPAITAPEPRPSLSLRPRALSVSSIETWMKNPYALYANKILKLEKLPILGNEPGADLRGGILHQTLARFTDNNPVGSDNLKTPDACIAAFMRDAEAVIARYKAHPRIRAFWLPRIARFARWFAETEPSRRCDIASVIAETSGTYVFETPGGPFKLEARADRLDVGTDGLVITDYKSGQTPPTPKHVETGHAPQLLLEAVIALFGTGFAHTDRHAHVTGLRYISASGGRPPGSQHDIALENIETAAESAADRLASLVTQFDNEATAYRAVRRYGYSYDYDDFAHLARVAEWSGTGTTARGSGQ